MCCLVLLGHIGLLSCEQRQVCLLLVLFGWVAVNVVVVTVVLLPSAGFVDTEGDICIGA